MLHKILHNVDHLLHCKLSPFAMLIDITRHTAQQNVLHARLFVSEIVYLMGRFYQLSGRYWEALYKKGNEDKGILILRSILLIFLPLFL